MPKTAYEELYEALKSLGYDDTAIDVLLARFIDEILHEFITRKELPNLDIEKEL